MPKLFRFLLKHIITGIIIGWVILGSLLWFDVLGFGSLVMGSSSRYIALALLGVSFAVTFGSASLATAVLLGDEFNSEDDGDRQSGVTVDPLSDDNGLLQLVPMKTGKSQVE